MNQTAQNATVRVDRLRIGMYIFLDLGWLDHPFGFNNFKIRSQSQIDTIAGLGLQQVRWDPAKSDALPLAAPLGTGAEAERTPPAALPPNAMEMMAVKHARIERVKRQREQIVRMEKLFVDTANTLRAINKNLFSQPKETIAQAERLIERMVESFLAAPEVAIHTMSEKAGSADLYFHSLNVAVLSMIIARDLRLPAPLVEVLGVGCLFHDIGLVDIPSLILNKDEPLNPSERRLREMHCQYGYEIGKRFGMPLAIQHIAWQHHECHDGSGYPRRLKGDQIDLMARIVGIANHYDNLCNPADIGEAMTPHEALSLMFAQQREKFDPTLLPLFIRCMGVYPPGTVVRLSNEVLALVTTVNASRPLKPTVLVYDPDTPKTEAIMVDLEQEPDINISKAIRPSQLPREVYDYLSQGRRVSYYFDAVPGERKQNG